MARRTSSGAPTEDLDALHPNVELAVQNLWQTSFGERSGGRRALAIAAIADALEHALEHADDAGLKALEHLAKEARKYSRSHKCFEVAIAPEAPRKAELRAPTRAELIQELVGIVDHGPSGLAHRLASRLLLGGGLISLGLHPKPEFFDQLNAAVSKAAELGRDSEGVVVDVLVSLGLQRRRARDVVKSAFRNLSRSPKRRRG